MDLKIATYNMAWLQGEGSEGSSFKKHSKIHFSSGLSMVSRFIEENKIDFIGIQEIDFHAQRSHFLNQAQILQEKTNMYGVKLISWDLPFLPFPYHNPWGKIQSGAVSLSKYPITLKEEVLFDAPSSMAAIKRLFYLKRYIQVIEMHILDKKICIFNLHLEAFDHEEKRNQISVLSDMVQKHNPSIILGDFNTLPLNAPKTKFKDMDYTKDDSPRYLNEILNNYTDSFGDKLTFPLVKLDRRLDYIWVRNDIGHTILNPNFQFNPSDHEALVLSIKI